MTTLREAAQQALEALAVATNCLDGYYIPRGKPTLPEIEDAIAALRAALAEPQEPDSPERRCGGPGCDGTCCQPVQEPLTDTYVQNVPDKCDRIVWRGQYFHLPVNSTSEPVQEPGFWGSGDGYWIRAEDKAIRPDRERFTVAFYTAPPQRPAEPLTEEEIWALYYALPSDDFERSDRIDFARAIERAHGIKEEK